MKFAVINDIHIGPKDTGYINDLQRKMTGQSERLIKTFVEVMNEKEKPSFVVNLGDTIEDVNDKKTDFAYFKKATDLLSALKMPVHYLAGNHDVKSISQKEISRLLGYEKMYYSFDCGDYHFIALCFERVGEYAEIPKPQMDWLEKDLEQTDKATIVFSHYGLADDDMRGNFWFEKMPEHAVIRNRKAVRNVLEKSGRVKAVVSAHQHWNRMLVHNGIPYFTVTSMVENFNNDGKASEAYSLVKISKSKIILEVKGNDPAKYGFRIKWKFLNRLFRYLRV